MSCGFKMLSGFKIFLKQWKNHFFKLNFLKKSKTDDALFYIELRSYLLYIHTLKSFFYASCGFYQLVNKQGDYICQPESQFGNYYPICHTILRHFIHLLLYKDRNEYMEMSTVLKKRVILTTLVHLKQRSGCY